MARLGVLTDDARDEDLTCLIPKAFYLHRKHFDIGHLLVQELDDPL